MTLGIGIHDAVPANLYHADCAGDAPSLSSSLIHTLCTQSPAHAFAQHPRLNPFSVIRDDREAFDIGTAAHAILLCGDDSIVQIDADDWRTKVAKEAREAARQAGRVPLLNKHAGAVRAMVASTRRQLDAHQDGPFLTGGKPEQTIVWQEDDGTWCRARADWLHDDLSTIDDYKTSGISANPDVFSRTLFGNGYDIQAAWYLRGLQRVTGEYPGRLNFRFIVQETSAPYALSVVALGPDAMALAKRKIEYAIKKWQDCLSRNSWPSYPTQTCYASLPSYEETRWLNREDLDADASIDARKFLEAGK